MTTRGRSYIISPLLPGNPKRKGDAMRRIVSCTALVFLLAAETLQAETIVSEAYHDAYVYDGDSGLEGDQYTTSTASPTSADLYPSVGDGSARTEMSRSPISLDVIFTHQRPTSLYSFAQSSGWDTFTVDVPSSYAISGTYSMSGAGTISLAAYLYDSAADQYLFDNGQQSVKTPASPGQQFTLGSTAGDDSYRSGFLTGSLAPGREYQFYYNAYIHNYPDDSGSASANGQISIAVIGVPEPSTSTTLMIVSLLGGLGGVVGWRRRRRAA